MQFLFPLFLLAALTAAIPILIHLFNLRKYKTVFFPHTRFLKNIQLRSQKQSQIRYKWLLALRILFLLALVLAFAQPFFFKNRNAETAQLLQIIYLDNSPSMSVKSGTRTLLDIAKASARRQVQAAPENAKFLLLTNDKPASYETSEKEKVLAAVNNTEVSFHTLNASKLFTNVQGLIQSEAATGADLYYYSDFQKSSFPAQADASQVEQINLHGIAVRGGAAQNVYIDTVMLQSPVLQTGVSNKLIVKSRTTETKNKENTILQLSVNGQVKSAATLEFSSRLESTDTLSFQVNNAGWQQIMLTVNDAIRFDDTFRIAAKSTSNLSVLVWNEGNANPFIQTAFRAYSGFRLDQKNTGQNADLKQYNLIILNGITQWNGALIKQVQEALQDGKSVCIFPGKTNDPDALNAGLNAIAGIRISGIDNDPQTATNLQPGSDLVKNIFDRLPENVQLPTASWHYRIDAPLDANQQSIISFRNADPFLAQYTPSRGRLYVCATSAELSAGNFPGSYFFVPFLYEMTAQSEGGNVYAITAGSNAAVYLPLKEVSERNMLHLYAEGMDIIPPQRPNGAGVEVYAGTAVQQPAFYKMATSGAKDSTSIAVNAARSESDLAVWSDEALRSGWNRKNISWQNANDTVKLQSGAGFSSFPLWKVCVFLALLLLAAETFLLTGAFQNPKIAVS